MLQVIWAVGTRKVAMLGRLLDVADVTKLKDPKMTMESYFITIAL